MRLTRQEVVRLIIEGIVTVGIMLLLLFAFFEITQAFGGYFPSRSFQLQIIERVFDPTYIETSLYIEVFTYLLIIVFIGVVVYWRLRRRKRHYEMQHIIEELHFIAQGNYDHRIRSGYQTELQPVVDSIHMLVDNTVEAMEEERRIERSKDELITNVSHDIRTPLTSVIGYLGLLDHQQYHDEEEAQKYIHIAYSRATQMKQLVEDLFEYTRISQNQNNLNLATIDLVQMVEQISAEFELEAQAAGMKIEIEATPYVIMLKADPEKLVRVFNNLLTNAFKYGRKGNHIVIKLKKYSTHIHIQVMNNGKPISKEAQSYVFERFYREEEARSDSQKGSGLGLAIVKSIVNQHHGKITVAVQKGWTIFNITLPMRGTVMDEETPSHYE